MATYQVVGEDNKVVFEVPRIPKMAHDLVHLFGTPDHASQTIDIYRLKTGRYRIQTYDFHRVRMEVLCTIVKVIIISR